MKGKQRRYGNMATSRLQRLRYTRPPLGGGDGGQGGGDARWHVPQRGGVHGQASPTHGISTRGIYICVDIRTKISMRGAEATARRLAPGPTSVDPLIYCGCSRRMDQ
jgi:hypothetical protein